MRVLRAVQSARPTRVGVRALSGAREPLVTVRKLAAEKVAVITLNSPSRLNALTESMGDELTDRVHELSEASADFGAVVLTGAGRAFSAGGDLDFLRRRHADSPSRNASIMHRFYERFLVVRRLPVPVIAAINGPAVGAGLCLALACDIRLAAKEAKLGVTFVGLGLHPGMGATHFLPRIVGPQHAARLLLTGDMVSGDEAAAMGLVLESVAGGGDAVVARATELAARMAKQGPVAVRSCVRSLRLQQDEALQRSLWREADAQSYCYASKDLGEGVEAVAGKRAPVFGQFERYGDQ